ncbi:uncharacterized protein L3040_002124 [Drepanopeziza brunnea f. sp. 'multigermtubi']|uniref:Glycoside hydrolase 131 catalytic N-terminal domain-containing protein n=1 Tax=Marssonina brunnea f. sp. multigermtubi (strain MB_m1) TaxID=1072389 RepID=K1X138_MARBU|nr:uncharacterized protein MBM_02939 [Drepanopeziza brunnea f. sp. 'multigermtubi' MB_m1]EKD18697.1 hypothetical protein MBM_02939 [Drepanopeziza brunnea f. sp. 'multigermtubi' MB_m1]KAJ5052373.1 hypothetical protein L3040_002124 [Drepanopeziza brunnea f. sp. 'multigermtubi']
MIRPFVLLNSISVALAGTILWDGRFNDVDSVAAIGAWSWSNQVGPYQYYIHGPSPIDSYVNLDAANKNPADTGSTKGVKLTLDDTSFWNGQTMRRTELIPQTTAAINAGKVFYHFSMSRSSVNPPSEAHEHQIAFFESHFVEMKSGWQSGAPGTTDSLLRWVVSGSTEWNVTWEADVWHNVAYAIDFDAGSVAFYHSTGAEDLVLTVPAVTVQARSDGKDWHLGMLELPRDGYPFAVEDIYFSGVYVESGEITLSVSGPGGAAPGTSPPTPATPATPAVAKPDVAVTAPAVTAPAVADKSTSNPAKTVETKEEEEEEEEKCE